MPLRAGHPVRVLLLGANGFIGRAVAARLLTQGHAVTAAVRDPGRLLRMFPDIRAVRADLNRDLAAADWLPRLAGCGAVVNCAGILQQRRGASIRAVHVAAPAALYDACAETGVRRIIHLSAISADDAAGTDYAATKREAERDLAARDLDWVILRPSLVYATHGSYGGTSTLRALAAAPFVVPVIGAGGQAFRPLHIDDLAEAVCRLVADREVNRTVLAPVGPEPWTLRRLALRLRGWLGLPPAPVLAVPMPLIRAAAWAGDRIGRGAVTTTALKQLEYGNAATGAPSLEMLGIVPRTVEQALTAGPAHAADRWHARLAWIRPILRTTLVLLWAGSGLAGLLAPLAETTRLPLALGLPQALATTAVIAASACDLLIAAALALRFRPGLLAAIQLAFVAGYTLVLTAAEPALWAEPLGPLLKNLPILAAILALWAVEDDR